MLSCSPAHGASRVIQLLDRWRACNLPDTLQVLSVRRLRIAWARRTHQHRTAPADSLRSRSVEHRNCQYLAVGCGLHYGRSLRYRPKSTISSRSSYTSTKFFLYFDSFALNFLTTSRGRLCRLTRPYALFVEHPTEVLKDLALRVPGAADPTRFASLQGPSPFW